MTAYTRPGRVPAGSCEPDGVDLAFASVRELLRAGELLRSAGFDVLVVPRRVPGCGALLLLPRLSVEAALALLAAHSISPVEEVNHERQ